MLRVAFWALALSLSRRFDFDVGRSDASFSFELEARVSLSDEEPFVSEFSHVFSGPIVRIFTVLPRENELRAVLIERWVCVAAYTSLA